MQLIDWIIVAAYFLLSVIIGVYYSKRAGKSVGEFFLSGRNLPWWLAGTSMVATTFAADTPLAVTELVAKNGIAGNWLWWNFLFGSMLTVFFFARLWRRAGILTDVEFVEVRYSGKTASFLRGFKALYLGLFVNTVIIGWVNVAMVSILTGFFGVSEEIVRYYVFGAMLIVAIYSALRTLGCCCDRCISIRHCDGWNDSACDRCCKSPRYKWHIRVKGKASRMGF